MTTDDDLVPAVLGVVLVPVRLVTDNRIVLPLDRTVMAANTLCSLICPGFLGPHDEDCLLPLLLERERLLAEDATWSRGKISPDCQVGGVKCRACTICAHDCHRPYGGRFWNRLAVPALDSTGGAPGDNP